MGRGYNGVIKFGKTNQLDISETSWNKSIASVLEDSYLFTATVERNIALNDPIDTNKLQHCIKLSNLENFIDGLANGLNTLLDPNGENISTGEKQRILLARALYRDADYLFLDEITSAQDVLNERVILENLADIATKKTVIVITHRLNTIRNADLILMFEKGMIVESGTHEELISKNGKYFSFISNQSNIAQEI